MDNTGFGYGMENQNSSTKKVPKKKIPKNAEPRRRSVVKLVGGADRPFLVTIILLLCLGTVMVFSASYPYANANFNGDSYHFARRQLIFVIPGIAAMLIIAKVNWFNYYNIRKLTKLALIVSIILLAGVLVVGKNLGGATRWYSIGPITVQPSEIVKFTLVMFFADYADRYAEQIRTKGSPKSILTVVLPFVLICGAGAGMLIVFDNKVIGAVFAGAILLMALAFLYISNMKKTAPAFYYGVLPYIIILGIVGVLLYLQPHMSGLIIMAGITFAMMFMGGTNLFYLISGAGVGAVGLFVIAMTMGHSSSRIKVWQDPFSYLLEGGWQPAQSLYAIGSGGFWGVGFGNSRQKHLYLPEPQNDYIFSIWCEEMGFIGAMLVICIFLFFIYRGILIGLRAPDRFSSLLVIGIIMHVGLQMVLNIAVVTNSLPSTGISLPFFSYGGTSILILLAEMGVVLSVSRFSSVEKSTGEDDKTRQTSPQ